MIERRAPFQVDEAKFSTQKAITYALLTIFAAVTAVVLYQNDQSERSMVLQTIINLTLLGVGYWLGSSKDAANQAASARGIAERKDGIDLVTPGPVTPAGVTPAAEVVKP